MSGKAYVPGAKVPPPEIKFNSNHRLLEQQPPWRGPGGGWSRVYRRRRDLQSSSNSQSTSVQTGELREAALPEEVVSDIPKAFKDLDLLARMRALNMALERVERQMQDNNKHVAALQRQILIGGLCVVRGMILELLGRGGRARLVPGVSRWRLCFLGAAASLERDLRARRHRGGGDCFGQETLETR